MHKHFEKTHTHVLVNLNGNFRFGLGEKGLTWLILVFVLFKLKADGNIFLCKALWGLKWSCFVLFHCLSIIVIIIIIIIIIIIRTIKWRRHQNGVAKPFLIARQGHEKNFGKKEEEEEDDESGKSTLWTDTGVDQNLPRDLGAISPYEFQGKFVWTNGPFHFLFREIRVDQWHWKSGKKQKLQITRYPTKTPRRHKLWEFDFCLGALCYHLKRQMSKNYVSNNCGILVYIYIYIDIYIYIYIWR